MGNKLFTITLTRNNEFLVKGKENDDVMQSDNFKEAYWYCMGFIDAINKGFDTIGITDEAKNYAFNSDSSNYQLLHNLAMAK